MVAGVCTKARGCTTSRFICGFVYDQSRFFFGTSLVHQLPAVAPSGGHQRKEGDSSLNRSVSIRRCILRWSLTCISIDQSTFMPVVKLMLVWLYPSVYPSQVLLRRLLLFFIVISRGRNAACMPCSDENGRKNLISTSISIFFWRKQDRVRKIRVRKRDRVTRKYGNESIRTLSRKE